MDCLKPCQVWIQKQPCALLLKSNVYKNWKQYLSKEDQ